MTLFAGSLSLAAYGDTPVGNAAEPSWLALSPPLLAIALAVLLRNVLVALFAGIWVGAWGLAGWDLAGLGQGLLDTVSVHLVGALNDADHAAVLIFSSMIGGMAGIVVANGGMLGLAQRIATQARTKRRGQVATSLVGLIVFFDDYANMLVVGQTMRSVTDRLRISRQKLAFIVDSTAAPVACVAPISTWIGYEVGLIAATAEQLSGFGMPAYGLFLQSLAYSFYPFLMLFFVLLVAATGRDFGAMRKAEQSAAWEHKPVAATTEDPIEEPPQSVTPTPRAINALIPIGVLVVSVFCGLLSTGEGETLLIRFGNGDSYKAMMWGSLLSVLAAGALSVGQRLMTLEATVEAWFGGVKSLLHGLLILILAWALSAVTQALGTADLLGSLVHGNLPIQLLPALVFILSALVSFAVGSAWGTMAVVLPIALQIVWQQLGPAVASGGPAIEVLLPLTVACVLGGAVFGDHCSPISDTTVISSTATGCDHLQHVKTQLPYALLVAGVGLVFGIVPVAYGLPWWIAGALAAIVLTLVQQTVGRSTDR